MTPEEFVEAIRKMHEPKIWTTVSVTDDDPSDPEYIEGPREPTLQEQADGLEVWCSGCRCDASKCRVQHLLIMVEAR